MQGKRLLERYSRRWEDNISMDLRDIGCEYADRFHMSQYRD